MSKIALIGKKLGMTNLFIDNRRVPVTLIEVLPNNVVSVRNYGDKFGLVLAGNEEIKDKKFNKPQRDEALKKGIKFRRSIKEFSWFERYENKFDWKSIVIMQLLKQILKFFSLYNNLI